MQWTPAESVPFVIPWYGRWILPTVGQVWPKPQEQTSSETFFVLRPTTFQFQVLHNCHQTGTLFFKNVYQFLGSWWTLWYHWRSCTSLLPNHLLSGRGCTYSIVLCSTTDSSARASAIPGISRFSWNRFETAVRIPPIRRYGRILYVQMEKIYGREISTDAVQSCKHNMLLCLL